MFPDGYEAAGFEERKQALRLIIHGYTLVTFAAGIFVWFALDDPEAPGGRGRTHWDPHRESLWRHVGTVIRMPPVWMTAVIVICAYVAYKGFDNYSLYAVQGFGLSEVEAARITAIGAWVRPVAAVTFGLLGDRYLVSRMTVVCFAMLLASQAFFALYTPAPGLAWVLVANILLGSSAMFGLRALYFALFEESGVPVTVTGTAVGIVSVLGYMPDVFVGYVGGRLLDAAPGLPGHQHYFWFLAAFAALGLVTSLALQQVLRKDSPVTKSTNLE
jgi:nitrate/nitrite transporter NarK